MVLRGIGLLWGDGIERGLQPLSHFELGSVEDGTRAQYSTELCAGEARKWHSIWEK